MLPTVGRIVHYGVKEIAHGPDSRDIIVPHAAMITRVDDPEAGAVTLQIFHPNGSHNIQKATQTDDLTEGAWMWPPRD